MAAPPLPEAFLCPITSEIMADPVSTGDGHTYEREAIAEWLAAGHTLSPLTGAPLAHRELVPNHALRAAIQEFVAANPALGKDLYRPQGQPKPASAPPVASAKPPPPPDVSEGAGAPPFTAAAASSSSVHESAPVPVGLPVYEPVKPPPAPPLTGLTASDLEACGQLGVADWAVYARGPVAAPAYSGGFFGRSKAPAPPLLPAPMYDPALEPVVRVGPADGGGVALSVQIDQPARLLRLAMRLAAPGCAPLAALRISAKEGFGPGTGAPMTTEGDGFALLTRVLRSASDGAGGGASVGGMRELAIEAIGVSDRAAEALACALDGHPSLTTLELWNVGLQDAGARSVGRLAASGRLEKLNLGKNLLLGETREAIEATIDKMRVRFIS